MQKREIVSSIVYFALVFGFVSLTETQIITMDRYVSVVIFLVAISLLIIYFFKNILVDYFNNIDLKKTLSFVVMSLLVHGLTSYFIINFMPQPNWPFSSQGTSFLLMNDYYIWAKPLDILVQQLLILLLVLKLSKLGLSLKSITLFFVVGFGFIHILQIFKTDLIIGLLFTAGAVMFSFVFPYMILKKQNGFIYNYILHLFIYNLAAIIAYTLY